MPPVFEIVQIEMDEIVPRDPSATFRFGQMADCRQATDCLFRITSSLDQDVTIQLVGHIVDDGKDENGVVNIGVARALGAGDSTGQVITIKVNLQEAWHPYLGLAVITVSDPTAGVIQASAYIRNPLLVVS